MKKDELHNISTDKAVSCVKSGDRIFFQGAAMTTNILIDALCDHYRVEESRT
ncbi:hypothetical protein [Autumnicola psychrophila]|uniref:Uncharacterized protein n=1 Tax=Autumnicola psychrophila TaxID=3075592 RepID=A0ABU3DNF1_9FLAO|nr:hypothetical protein [Zunongwangia sp. F225]MDT0685138.1 hypothetical protein [Zunongwangia sp. F225]